MGVIWLHFPDSQQDDICLLPNYPEDQLVHFIKQVTTAYLRGRQEGMELAAFAIEAELNTKLKEIVIESIAENDVCDMAIIEEAK